MTDAARRRRIEEVCDAALDREVGERPVFVAAACGSDETLRQEVEALLAHAQTAEGFLASSIGAVAANVMGEAHTTVSGLADRQRATWGHFSLLEQIGAGGFGEVYRANDTKLDREVALKLFPASSAGRTRSARHVLEEARLLARLRHPHVVTVYGADKIDDHVGIWMELIRGQTLQDLVRAHGPLAATEAARIGVDLCDALTAVHHAGLLHGDIKAQNVMREAGGRTVLMDFGAGVDLRPDVTQSGEHLIGTLHYLAPELLAGNPRTVAVDIYALGVLLYYLVSGTCPVDGATAAVVADTHRRGAQRRLRDVRPDVPDGFARIVERATAPDPQERFAGTGALWEALRVLRTGGQPVTIATALSDPFERRQRTAHLGLRPTECFVGRNDDLKRLHQRLHGASTTALTVGRVVAITALGGTGKTTLARMYAELYWSDYVQLLWIDARRGYESELARLCEMVLPDIAANLREAPDKDRARRVLSELENLAGSRLLIIDNAEEEASVIPWLPKTGDVHTLITSRFAYWETISVYPLAVLDAGAARDFLLTRSRRLATDNNGDAERAACDELAERLGFLPLALEQAAAYILKQGPDFGFRDYLRLFSDAQKELLSIPVRGTTEYPSSVFATWRTTTDKLSAGARVMLRSAAFLAPTEIPLGIFVDSAAELGNLESEFSNNEPADTTVSTEFRVRAWRQALAEYSLITVTPGHTFAIHPLLQAVERDQLDSAARQRWISTVMNAFVRHAPRPDLEHWPTWRLLASHGEMLCWQGRQARLPHPNTTLLRSLCIFHSEQGHFADALARGRQAMEHDDVLLGPTHPDTMASMYSVAVALALQGESYAAEPLFRQVLSQRQQTLGRDAADTLKALQWVGNVLFSQGNRAAAELFHERALAGFEKLDPDSHHTRWSRWWLGHSRTDLSAAEPLLRRAVAEQARLQGDDHFLTLHYAVGLAHCLAKRGKHAEAERVARRSATGLERIVGPDHRWTSQAMHTLAHCLVCRGHYLSAEQVARRALDLASHNQSSRTTWILTHSLARIHEHQGAFDKAESLYRRRLKSMVRQLGASNPEVRQARQDWKRCRQRIGIV